MATVVQRYINSASSGGDGTTNATSGATAAWASLSAADSALNTAYSGNCVTADVQVNVDVTGLAPGKSGSAMAAITQDATRFIRYRAASGQMHLGYYGAGKAGFDRAGGSIIADTVPSYTRFENLQFVNDSTGTSFGDGLTWSSAATNIQVLNCVFHRYNRSGTATDGSALLWSGIVQKGIIVANCVFSGTWWYAFDANYNDTGSSIVLYNNTGVGMVGGGFRMGGGPVNNSLFWKNNRMESAGTSYAISGTQTTANNFSSDTSSPDGASYRSKTGTYTNSGGFDYSLQTGDAGIDQGADLSADGTYAFTTDIVGTTRSGTWDIGAFNYAAAASFHAQLTGGRPLHSLVNGGLAR